MRSSITPRKKIQTARYTQDQTASVMKQSVNSKFGERETTYLEKQTQLKKYKQMVNDLKQIVKEQNQKYQDLKQRMELLGRRTVIREKQFHNIIQKTNKNIHNYKLELAQPCRGQQQNRKSEQITKMYMKIFQNFQRSNDATNNFIQKRYNQSMLSMQNRLSHIMINFQQEVQKMKRITNIDKNGLQKSLHQVIGIAKTVQEDNISLKSKIDQYIHRNKLLQQEKDLLIEQMVNKKSLIVKLYAQNRKLRLKCDKDYQNQTSYLVREKNENLRQSYNKKELKGSIQHRDNTNVINYRESKNLGGIFDSFQNSYQQKGSQQIFKASKAQLPKNQFVTEVKHQNSNQTGKNQTKIIKHSSRYEQGVHSSKQRNRQKVIGKSLNMKPNNQQPPFRRLSRNPKENQRQQNHRASKSVASYKDNEDVSRLQNAQKAIAHLKICLQRQKKRNIELSRMLIKIQSQNQQVNTAILQIIRQIKQNKNRYQRNDQNSSCQHKNLQLLLKSQKLFETIRNLKQRLSMLQRPSINCGWGQQTMDDIMRTELKEEGKLREDGSDFYKQSTKNTNLQIKV